jgi:hypothetical protein
MIAVCALGVQSALVQVSLHGMPRTAVVTTNVARFTIDSGTILLGAVERLNLALFVLQS